MSVDMTGLSALVIGGASGIGLATAQRAMAADHVREGIRVNCVNPDTADTPWVACLLEGAEDPDAERAALNAGQPMGRLVTELDRVEGVQGPRTLDVVIVDDDHHQESP